MVPKTLLKSFSYRELRSLRMGLKTLRLAQKWTALKLWTSFLRPPTLKKHWVRYQTNKSPESDEFKEKALEIVSEYKNVGFLMLVDLPGPGIPVR